jgi:outer membrane protein TolC
MKQYFFFYIFLAVPHLMALDLNTAQQTALENSPQIKNLKIDSAGAGWEKRRAFAGFLPKIDIDGRHLTSERFEELEVPFSGQVFVMPAIQPYSSLGVSASINLFNGFKDLNKWQGADLASAAAENRLAFATEQTKAQVRNLFYRALGSQILVDVAEQNIKTLESHLSDFKSREKYGASTRYDSLRVEVQLEEARTEKTAAENNVTGARQKLFESLGIADDGSLLQGVLPEDFSQINPDTISLRLESRSDRSALMAERDRRDRLSAAATSHWWPEVSFFGNYEW